MNKKAYIKFTKNIFFVLLVIGLLFLTFSSQQTSAGKSEQFYRLNSTCEEPSDSVLWSAVASKDTGNAQEYSDWTPATSCPGSKDCDIENMSVYVRFINSGADPSQGACNQGTAQIANSTETDANPSVFSRYAACDNESIGEGGVLGPRWECASSQTDNVCSTKDEGYNETRNYNVSLFAANAGVVKENIIMDIFNINYTWCWIPIIENVSGG